MIGEEAESPPKPRIRWEPIGAWRNPSHIWVLRNHRGTMLGMQDDLGELIDMADYIRRSRTTQLERRDDND